MSVDYLDLDDLYEIVKAVAGDPREVVRDHGLLASAAARPATTLYGEDAYPSVAAKAAALLQSLVTSHPLVDDNKRLGLVATRLFYRLNGITIDATQDDKVDLILAVANGSLRDVEGIAAVLRRWEVHPPE